MSENSFRIGDRIKRANVSSLGDANGEVIRIQEEDGDMVMFVLCSEDSKRTTICDPDFLRVHFLPEKYLGKSVSWGDLKYFNDNWEYIEKSPERAFTRTNIPIKINNEKARQLEFFKPKRYAVGPSGRLFP